MTPEVPADFLHEHPQSASSWNLDILKKFIKQVKPHLVNSHMCAFGMTSVDEHGRGHVLKPTTFMTNSSHLARKLDKQCNRNHRHVHLMNGRAKDAAIYPDQLCNEICKGIREQIDHDEFIKRLPSKIVQSVSKVHFDINSIDINSIHNDEPDAEYYVDDVTGAPLDPKLVKEAKRVEMSFFCKKGVYYYDTMDNCITKTCKKPIAVRWVDVNKGDDENLNCRSRLDAKEINIWLMMTFLRLPFQLML